MKLDEARFYLVLWLKNHLGGPSFPLKLVWIWDPANARLTKPHTPSTFESLPGSLSRKEESALMASFITKVAGLEGCEAFGDNLVKFGSSVCLGHIASILD